MNFNRSRQYIFLIVKYLFPIGLIFLTFSNHGNKYYFVTEILELLGIFTLSNVLLKKQKVGQIVNNILMILFNAQLVVLYFGNSYISMIMLSNLHSLEDLIGKAPIYILGVILVLIFSFLPIKEIKASRAVFPVLFVCAIGIELVVTSISNYAYSPLYSYIDIANQYYQKEQMNAALENVLGDSNTQTGIATEKLSYYKESIEDYRKKETGLVEQPNVILIFTEGLSQNIISDERNIMPNVEEYQNKSLSFDNYFNHTAATYRGLIGQLFSGYQLNDFDNNRLVSIQSILSSEGYNTFFFNVEPHNDEFATYLRNFEFDQLLIDETVACNGMANTISDTDAYNILFSTAEEQAATGEPFFMAIYTFGTHTSLDSTSQKFGDGSDAEINKFYNLDYQFGEFMKKFESSSLSDNTIIVFTTDHATYQDDSFTKSFPGYYRAGQFCDEIPMFIYYKGITPEVIDVNGRNTLCLAPTILDYLDISAPNYFLGTSLFSGEIGSDFETSYTDTYVYLKTQDAEVTTNEGDRLTEFVSMLHEYFVTKIQAEEIYNQNN